METALRRKEATPRMGSDGEAGPQVRDYRWPTQSSSIEAGLVLLGALISLAAAITAFVSAGGRTRKAKVPFIATGMLGVIGVLCGLYVAFGTALIVC